MKTFDLIVVTGSKAIDKQVFLMLSGKNIIGTNIKCTTEIDLELIKPQHFELLVTKTGRFTLIPLVGGMQIMSKNKKLKELQPNQCYDLDLKQTFYIERTYSCYLDESVNKKSAAKADSGKQSLWTPKQKQQEVKETKKKVKKEITQDEEENQSESTQSKSDQFEDYEEEYKVEEDGEDFEMEYKMRQKKSKVAKSVEKKNTKSTSSCDTTLIQEIDQKKSSTKNKKSEVQQLNQKGKKQKTVRVILSNCELTDSQKKKMIELGAVFVEDQEDDFDVVVMESFRRRAKLLIGLNKQAWIISKNWILDCIDDGELIEDYCEYLLEITKEDEAKFENFDLDEIQAEVQKNKGNQIFKNCCFQLQSKYKNISAQELEAIIKSGGGIISNGEGKTNNKQKLFSIIEKEGACKINNPVKSITYVDPEYVLLSSLKQEIQTQFIYKF